MFFELLPVRVQVITLPQYGGLLSSFFQNKKYSKPVKKPVMGLLANNMYLSQILQFLYPFIWELGSSWVISLTVGCPEAICSAVFDSLRPNFFS